MAGVRPRPPPTRKSSVTSPAVSRRTRTPMSWTWVAARSAAAPLKAILNLRGNQSNSGCCVDHCRVNSQYGRGSTASSAATPANWSVVMLRMQLPLVWMACISTLARSARMSGTASKAGQLNWMFWRVVRWP